MGQKLSEVQEPEKRLSSLRVFKIYFNAKTNKNKETNAGNMVELQLKNRWLNSFTV